MQFQAFDTYPVQPHIANSHIEALRTLQIISLNPLHNHPRRRATTITDSSAAIFAWLELVQQRR